MTLAFVFPGQGSQTVGMLDGFAGSAAVQAMLEQADAALGESLSTLIAQGPAETLSLTVNTQPAMLAAGYACWLAWRDAGGPAPTAVAGHSLGEYTALAMAGAVDFADALRLVRLRAQAMQEAVPVGQGGMAAILGLDDDAVRQACREAAEAVPGEVVEPANYNAPAQVVIAGHRQAVDRACERAKALGAKRALPLLVSAPFHSSLLRPAGERLAQALAAIELRTPLVPLVNNVDVAIETDPARIRDALVRQAYGPVRWVEVVQRLKSLGVTGVIEFGPGKVLSGLVSRIDRTLRVAAVYDPVSLEAALDETA
ncbi:MAG: [acyl-carrier-protein] S-malonyltransferase [Burkholderiales bacterium]|nr:MAG: [acyl-carrier-protein] S-malonyltransferase [Burkholderiales bacterium]